MCHSGLLRWPEVRVEELWCCLSVLFLKMFVMFIFLKLIIKTVFVYTVFACGYIHLINMKEMALLY